MMAESVVSRRCGIVWMRRRYVADSVTSPMYIYGPNRLLGGVDFGHRTFWRPPLCPALESMAKRLRFGIRTSQIPNMLGNIHLAGPHVVGNCGAQGRYFPEGASIRRRRRNFPTVYLRPKSATNIVDFGPRTSRRSPLRFPT